MPKTAILKTLLLTSSLLHVGAGFKRPVVPAGTDIRAPQPVARSHETDWLEQRRHEMKVLEAAEAAEASEMGTLNHRERAHRRRLQGRDPAHAGVREFERTLAIFKPAFMAPGGGFHNRKKGDL